MRRDAESSGGEWHETRDREIPVRFPSGCRCRPSQHRLLYSHGARLALSQVVSRSVAQRALPHLTAHPTRSAETFVSAGVRCAAWVYRPSAPFPKNAPVIVMAHGFGCVRALRLPSYAEHFAAAGYVVVVFDYRNFGDSDGRPRQLLDIAGQLADWRAAIGWARTLGGVDPERVVGWGTSLSGGHVITLAGTGTPLTAIIAQVPHVSGFAAIRATGIRHAVRLLPAAFEDTCRGLARRDPRYVDSVGEPGTLSVMATPDVMPSLQAMAAADGLSLNDIPVTVAARIVLRIGLYSPIRHAGTLTCPALIQVVDDDAITSTSAARRAVARMRHATLKTYVGRHFDVYVAPLFDDVVADQLAFLKSVVPSG